MCGIGWTCTFAKEQFTNTKPSSWELFGLLITNLKNLPTDAALGFSPTPRSAPPVLAPSCLSLLRSCRHKLPCLAEKLVLNAGNYFLWLWFINHHPSTGTEPRASHMLCKCISSSKFFTLKVFSFKNLLYGCSMNNKKNRDRHWGSS